MTEVVQVNAMIREKHAAPAGRNALICAALCIVHPNLTPKAQPESVVPSAIALPVGAITVAQQLDGYLRDRSAA